MNDAPLNHDKTGPDIARADFTWCMTAISCGHGIEATAAQLIGESTKARENGDRCAQMTAENAAQRSPAGTVLLVDGWQARNGTPTANVSSVTFPDGRRLFAGSSNESAPTK